MIYKYFGPPGTGKTHKLISRAKAYVKIGTPLNNILSNTSFFCI